MVSPSDFIVSSGGRTRVKWGELARTLIGAPILAIFAGVSGLVLAIGESFSSIVDGITSFVDRAAGWLGLGVVPSASLEGWSILGLLVGAAITLTAVFIIRRAIEIVLE